MTSPDAPSTTLVAQDPETKHGIIKSPLKFVEIAGKVAVATVGFVVEAAQGGLDRTR